jgi:hypothetical protein
VSTDPSALPGDELEDAATPAPAEQSAGDAAAVTDSENTPVLPVDPSSGKPNEDINSAAPVQPDVGTSPPAPVLSGEPKDAPAFSTTADQESDTTVPPLDPNRGGDPGAPDTSPAVEAANATLGAPVTSNTTVVTDGTGPATADLPPDAVLNTPEGDPDSSEGVSAPTVVDTTTASETAAPSATDGTGLGDAVESDGHTVTTDPMAVSDQTLPQTHPLPTVFDSPAYDDVQAVLGTPAPLAPGEGSTGTSEPPPIEATDAATSTIDTRVSEDDRAGLGSQNITNDLAEELVAPIARLLAEQGVKQGNVSQWVENAYAAVAGERGTARQQGEDDPYPLAG